MRATRQRFENAITVTRKPIKIMAESLLNNADTIIPLKDSDENLCKCPSLLSDILSGRSRIYSITFFHEEFAFLQYNLHQTFLSYIAFTYNKKLHGFKRKTK